MTNSISTNTSRSLVNTCLNSLIALTGTFILLCSCVEEYPANDHSHSTAVYKVFKNKSFVISDITNDNGFSLLDSLYACSKDDTFSVGLIAEGAAVLVLKIRRGVDWCGLKEGRLDIEEWSITDSGESASFNYYLPPKYQKERFTTRPGSKNSFRPDGAGNFILSTMDADSLQTHFLFRKVE